MDVAHAHFATSVHIPLPAQTAKPLMGVLVSAVQRLMPRLCSGEQMNLSHLLLEPSVDAGSSHATRISNFIKLAASLLALRHASQSCGFSPSVRQ